MRNKQAKRMIESATGGVWVNDAHSAPPMLMFIGDAPKQGFSLAELLQYRRYHSTVSLTANDMGKIT